MNVRDKGEELKVSLLKHLDSLFCNENKSTCVWVDNTLIIVDSKESTDNRKTDSVVDIQLNVSFCLNNEGHIVATCIK